MDFCVQKNVCTTSCGGENGAGTSKGHRCAEWGPEVAHVGVVLSGIEEDRKKLRIRIDG